MGWLLVALGSTITFYYTVWLNWKIIKRNRPRRFVSNQRALFRLFVSSGSLAGGVTLLASLEVMYFFVLLPVFALAVLVLGSLVAKVLKSF